ncbi:MAG: efflux RND transporter permease subunit, partial [Opitutus sp.]
GMTFDKIKDELDKLVRTPGAPAIWWMPIQTRIEMMATGIRSQIGIRVLGPDLGVIQQVAEQIEAVLKKDPNTATAFAERVTGGYYVDFNINRDQIARYGLTVGDVETIIESAIGGKTISSTVEGRERYPINVRYARNYREDLPALRRVLVPTPTGAQVPMEQLADIRLRTGPPGIRDENGMLGGFVFVDTKGIDLGTYVNRAKKLVADSVKLPPGYFLSWGGQYQYMLKARETLTFVIPLTLLIIFVLLYLNFKNVMEATIVLLSIPFALVGGIWLVWLLGYNFSVAVAVGFIALAGVAAETGVVMIVYLDEAWEHLKQNTVKPNLDGLYRAVMEGAVQRVRPKMMTVCAIIAGLLPILWSHGAGSLTMKRIAAPMVGGMVSSTILTLIIIPVVYFLWRSRGVEASPTEARPVRKLFIASIIIGTLVLGGGGWWLWHSLSGPSQPTAVVTTQTVGPYQFKVLGEGTKLRMGENAIRIEVSDATGKPVDVGSIWFELRMDMPGMAMQAAAQLEKGPSPGVFNGTIRPTGLGEWHASIGYESRKGKDSASFTTGVRP